MNNLSTYISLAAFIFGTIACWYSIIVVRWVGRNNKASVTLRELTQLQTELTEHADSIKALHTSLAKLRSRMGMRKLREKENSGGEPDSRTEPQAWKEWKRQQLAEAKQ